MSLQIIDYPIKKLRPHPKNARLHDSTNIKAIMQSLKVYKQRTPIVVWGKQNYVVKGCGTLEAAKKLGWKTIQIVRADNFSETEILSYSLADNKTTDLSEFDFEKVGELLRDLSARDEDLSVTGFQDYEVTPLIQAEWSPTLQMEETDYDNHVSEASLKGFSVRLDLRKGSIIDKAINLYRRKKKLPEISTEDIITSIAEEWFTSNLRRI